MKINPEEGISRRFIHQEWMHEVLTERMVYQDMQKLKPSINNASG